MSKHHVTMRLKIELGSGETDREQIRSRINNIISERWKV